MRKQICSVLVWVAAATSAGAMGPVPEWRSTVGPVGATAYDVVDTAEDPGHLIQPKLATEQAAASRPDGSAS